MSIGILLNLGCGGNALPGWENHDIDLDITRPLPHGDSTVRAIFAEHVIEHITGNEMYGFFRECYRILAPGGAIRLVFPDVLKIARLATPDYARFVATFLPEQDRNRPGSHIQAIATCHGHQQLLTSAIVLPVLASAGFRVEETPLYRFRHLDNSLVDGHWRAISNQWYELESSAIEGIKD